MFCENLYSCLLGSFNLFLGSGKTFVANAIEKLEKEHGKKVKRFDMEDEFKEDKHDVLEKKFEKIPTVFLGS